MRQTRTSPHSKSANSGFTLLELLVAIALVGLLMGLVVSGSNRLFDRDMKQAANRLASTMRYVYNKAATDGMYIRLVLDFNEQSYWIEATHDPYLLADPEKNIDPKPLVEPEGEAAEKAPRLKPPVPTFSQVTERLLKAQSLPSGIFFKDAYVEHQREAVHGGKVSITFFPNGSVEQAIINLRDDDDEVHYSLKTNPVNGRVKVEAEYRAFEEGERQ